LAKDESIVAFCDYDYPADDPVYAMGPLAGAKKLQRETMTQIRERFGARTARLCYPAVATTALGAIPGGLLMYGLTAVILKRQGKYQSVPQLAEATMKLFSKDWDGGELRLDEAYQAVLPEFHAQREKLSPSDIPQAFETLYKTPRT